MTLGGLAFPIVQGVFTGNERIASGRVDVELFSPVSFWRRALITLEVLPLDPRQAGAAGCSPDVDTAFIQFTRPTGNHHMINRALTRQAHAKRRSTRLLINASAKYSASVSSPYLRQRWAPFHFARP